MYKTILVLLCLLVIFTITAASAEVIGKTDKDVKAIAEPIMDNILAGMKENNYEKYSRDFDATMKEALPKDKFTETQKQVEGLLGNYKSRQYFGFLKTGDMTCVLWKGTFDKAKDDVLMKLVLTKRDKKFFVTGLWFQ